MSEAVTDPALSYLVFTDLLSQDLLYLNRVANYTLLYQLVKGFGLPILAKLQIPFFYFFRRIFHRLKLKEYTTISIHNKVFCKTCSGWVFWDRS
jgi:hypothetical protein